MTSKRIRWITAFGAAVIVFVFVAWSLIYYYRVDSSEMELPVTGRVSGEVVPPDDDPGLERVEVTRENVQAVIEKTLVRPEYYTREIVIESFWDNGSAVYNITAAVSGEMTSLRVISLSGGFDKRVIVTPEKLYIWYQGDAEPFIGELASDGEEYSPADENLTADEYRSADEWQMILTYEDIIGLDTRDIIEAGYTRYDGEDCIYAVFKSPLLGYTTKCYVSLEYGLIIGAEEYDGSLPVSVMATGACTIGEPDESAFILPDGTALS